MRQPVRLLIVSRISIRNNVRHPAKIWSIYYNSQSLLFVYRCPSKIKEERWHICIILLLAVRTPCIVCYIGGYLRHQVCVLRTKFVLGKMRHYMSISLDASCISVTTHRKGPDIDILCTIIKYDSRELPSTQTLNSISVNIVSVLTKKLRQPE